MRKRCTKCQRVSDVKPRERRCKTVVTRGFGSFARQYYCWGLLERVIEPKKAKPKKEESMDDHAAHDDADSIHRRGAARRREAMKNLDVLNDRIVDKVREQARLATRIRDLQNKASRLMKRIVMTDEEFEAERQKTIASFASRKTKRSRAVAFQEVK